METKSYFTDAGKKLLLDAAGSKDKITYTKAKMVYDRNHPGWRKDAGISDKEKKELKAITGFDDIRKEASITVVDIDDKDTIKLGASFTNKNQKEDIFYNFIGWYAKSETKDEFLFAITPAGNGDGVEITATEKDDGSADVAIDFYLNFVVEDMDNVVITASDTGVVTFPEMNLALEKQENKLSKKIAENSSKITDLDKKTVKSVNGVKPTGNGDVEVKGSILRSYDFDGEKAKSLQSERIVSGAQNLVDKGVVDQIATKFKDDEKSVKDNKSAIDDINNSKIPSIQQSIKDNRSAVDNNISTLDKAAVKSVDGVRRDANGNVAINTKVVKQYDFDTKTPTTENKQYNQIWPVDNLVLMQIADKFKNHADTINDLKSHTDFRSPTYQLKNKEVSFAHDMQDPGIYWLHQVTSNDCPWSNSNIYGFVVTTKGEGFIYQLFYHDSGRAWFRGSYQGVDKYSDWHELTNNKDDLKHPVENYADEIANTKIDFNNYLGETKTWKIRNCTLVNGPFDRSDQYGWLTTYHYDKNSVIQVYIAADSGNRTSIWTRETDDSHTRKSSWLKFADTTDINNLQNKLNLLDGALVDNDSVITTMLTASEIDNLTTSIRKVTSSVAAVGSKKSRDGYLLTFNNPNSTTGYDWKWQILLDNNGNIFYRNGLQGKWNNWKLSEDSSAIDSKIQDVISSVATLSKKAVKTVNGTGADVNGAVEVKSTILRNYDFNSDTPKTLSDEALKPKNQNLVDGSVVKQINAIIKQIDTSIKSVKSSNEQAMSEINNTALPSLKEELNSQMTGFVKYTNGSLTNPDDKTVSNFPQGITTIFNFKPAGYSDSFSGNLITVINPLSTWSWKFQLFVGVDGALGFRSIDGGNASAWSFIKDDNGNLASKGFSTLISRINDYSNLKKRVEALENKIK